MDEYIKREDAKKALDEYRISRTMSMYGDMNLLMEWRDGVERAISKLDDVPTADVVPRAEAVREVFKAFGVPIPENTTLEEAVESYKKTQKIIRNMAIANAKAEVAREIFADIEEMLIPENGAFYFDAVELAELKKKYTGDQK